MLVAAQLIPLGTWNAHPALGIFRLASLPVATVAAERALAPAHEPVYTVATRW